jgi:prepilin-type processing-associated H-X9-DG protein
LALYLNREAAVFRCPDDLRVGLYQGANPDLRGKTVPAARSYSMNVAIGTNPYRAGGKQPTDGAWLDGQHAHRANQIWFTFARTSDLRNPGPARTFVFLDEDYRSINDGLFALVGPYPGRQNYRMLDYPSSCHDGGGSFAFADGHVESHRWRDARTRLLGPGPPISQSQPGNVDIVWLAQHATALVRQPQLTAVGIAAGNTFQIALPALNGARYVLEYKDCLSATGWTALPAVTATNAGLLQLVDPGATSAQRFYRAWTP